MNISEEAIIDKYLAEEMDALEKAAFEKTMENDKELGEEISLRKGIIETLRRKEQVRKARAALNSGNKKTFLSIKYRKLLSYAASVIFLIVSPFFYATSIYSNKNLSFKNSEDLLATEIANIRDTTIVIAQNPLNEGLRYLDKSDLDNAANSFREIPAKNEAYLEAKLYLAYTNYQLTNYNDAVNDASIVINNSQNGIEIQRAEWIILLTKLASESLDNSFYKKLKAISENPVHIYNNKAQQLEDDLNSSWRRFVL